MYVFLNDRIVKSSEASLHVSDLAIQRGYGIFDFFRLRENVLLFVDDHLDRFFRSASIMQLEFPFPKENLLAIIKELTAKNQLKNSGIKLILTGGYSSDAWQISKPNFVIMQNELALLPDSAPPKGVRIITHEYLREIPQAKTINYSMGVWLQKKMREQQADDVLYHHKGMVSEFPRCNFFMVTKQGTVLTPKENILPGVTRKRILEMEGFTIQQAEISLKDIQQAEEAFLTSSTKRIQAIVSIDGRQIGNGKVGNITSQLLKKLIEKELTFVGQNK